MPVLLEDCFVDPRHEEPSEPIAFYAHRATCVYCAGIVKMLRQMTTLILQPDKCMCLQCGQRYHVDVGGDVDAWEREQWMQKERLYSRTSRTKFQARYKMYRMSVGPCLSAAFATPSWIWMLVCVLVAGVSAYMLYGAR